jgi:hypothetical protein
MWWLMPIIPAIWEEEIRRTAVQKQLGQKVSKTPSQSILDVVVFACGFSYMGDCRWVNLSPRPVWDKNRQPLPEK